MLNNELTVIAVLFCSVLRFLPRSTSIYLSIYLSLLRSADEVPRGVCFLIYPSISYLLVFLLYTVWDVRLDLGPGRWDTSAFGRLAGSVIRLFFPCFTFPNSLPTLARRG